MQIQIHINPQSPAELAEYIAVLQAHNVPASAFQPVPGITIAERGDPPLAGASRGQGEEIALAAQYRETTGQVLRRTKAEIAAGLSRLDCLRQWQAGTRAEPTDAEPTDAGDAPPPMDDGGGFF